MPMNLSNHFGSSFSPAVAISGNNVYVVWKDIRSGNFEILYIASADSGVTFDDILSNLSTNTGASESPTIGVS